LGTDLALPSARLSLVAKFHQPKYAPGARDPQALQTLTAAYCLLPCALKALAAVLLTTLLLRKTP
jgi:hypothetical protein